MSGELFTLIAAVLSIGWIPILLKFYRAWNSRRNPVSLAICLVIAYLIYNNIVDLAVYAFSGNPTWSMGALNIFNMLVCVNFYVAIRWSNRHFSEARKNKPRA